VKGADSRGMATVLRRVREPRQKSDESLRADVNKNVSVCSLAQWSVISLLSPIRPSGQYTESASANCAGANHAHGKLRRLLHR
jgi:hypothetical protein